MTEQRLKVSQDPLTPSHDTYPCFNNWCMIHAVIHMQSYMQSYMQSCMQSCMQSYMQSLICQHAHVACQQLLLAAHYSKTHGSAS